jgi:dGTPase
VGRRFIERTQPSLEAQLCNLADAIAYNAHDIDDGVRSGLLSYEQLLELPIWRRFHDAALRQHPTLQGKRLLYDTNRRVLSQQVYDLIEASQVLLGAHRPDSPDAARRAPPLIRMSAAMAGEVAQVKTFLRTRLYRHERVLEQTSRAKVVVRDLFQTFHAAPHQMPAPHSQRRPVLQAVVDYIAGMTDRFAWSEHARLCGTSTTRLST